MAILQNFSAYVKKFIDGAVTKNKLAGNNIDVTPYLYMNKRSYEIPLDIMEFVFKNVIQNKSRMDVFKRSKIALYKDLKELYKLVMCFGTNVTPTAIVDYNVLSGIYEPKVYRTNTNAYNKFIEYWGLDKNELSENDFLVNYPLCVSFGNSVLPLEYNEDAERWESVNFEFVNEKWFSVYFSSQKTNSPLLPEIIVVKYCIQDNNNPAMHFEGRVQTTKDPTNKKTDAILASVAVEIINNPTDVNFPTAIETCVDGLPSGGTYEHQFHNDEFKFGVYPIVSLKHTIAKMDKKSWSVYVVKVVTEFGERFVQLPSLKNKYEEAMFNTLTNFYPVEMPDGSISEPITSTDDDGGVADEMSEFMAFLSDGDGEVEPVEIVLPKYAITYFGKYEYVNRNDKLTTAVHLSFEEISDEESTHFRAFSDKEIKHYMQKFGFESKGPQTKLSAEEQIKARMAQAQEEIEPDFNIAPASNGHTAEVARTEVTDESEMLAQSAYDQVPDESVAIKQPKATTKKRALVGKSAKPKPTAATNPTDLPF